MLKYASSTMPRDYNIEKGRGVEMLKLETERLRHSTKQGFLGGVSQQLLSMIVAGV